MTEHRKRRKRQERDKRARPIQISQRDIEIIALLGRYRYLRSTYIEAFVGGNATALRWRLRDLFDSGYLQRPTQQWTFADARYVPSVYQLAGSGRDLLQALGKQLLVTDGGGANYLHTLLVCEIAASIEIGVRRNCALQFIDQGEILERVQQTHASPHNTLSFPLGNDHYLVPDALFGVRGPSGVVLYALEADRGTEPLIRRGSGSSYARKLEDYTRLIREGLHKPYLNTPAPLVVLHVLPTHTRFRRALGTANKMPFHLFRHLTDATSFGQLACPTNAFLDEPWSRDGYSDFWIAEAK